MGLLETHDHCVVAVIQKTRIDLVTPEHRRVEILFNRRKRAACQGRLGNIDVAEEVNDQCMAA